MGRRGVNECHERPLGPGPRRLVDKTNATGLQSLQRGADVLRGLLLDVVAQLFVELTFHLRLS